MRLGILLVLLVLISACIQKQEVPEKDLVVKFIQVRTGDAILIQTPDGANILVDGGNSVDALDYLKENGVRRLDAVIATHMHADHILGLWRIMEDEEFTVDNFYHNNDTRPIYLRQVFDFVAGSSDTLKVGDELVFGEVSLKVLWPPSNSMRILAHESVNDNSIVLKVSYRNFSMLLPGDCEGVCEQNLVLRGGIDSDVLKAGNHGLSSSSSRKFLENVSPGLIVVPGHVRESVFLPEIAFCSDREWINPGNANIEDFGVKVLNTKFDGTITVTTNGDNYYYVNYAGKDFEECVDDEVMERLRFASFAYGWDGMNFSVELYPWLIPAATWIRENTPKGAVFLNWWDHSHMIRGVGVRETVIYGPSRETLYTVSKYAVLTEQERLNVSCRECNPHERVVDVVDAFITFGAENMLEIMGKYGSEYVLVTEDDRFASYALLLIDGRSPEEFLNEDGDPKGAAGRLLLFRMIEGEEIKGFEKVYSDTTVNIYKVVGEELQPV